MASFQKFSYLYQRELGGRLNLSAAEERLLTRLVGHWYQLNNIPVGKVVSDISETSLATTYKHLKSLKLKKYIVIKQEPDDARVKYVEPGVAAEDFIQKMDHLMSRSHTKTKPKRLYRSMVF